MLGMYLLWTCRNIHLILLLLVLIRKYEVSSKEYYCTKAGTWAEAMTNCTASGGLPLTHFEVNSKTEFTLKDNITVWTADYSYYEYTTDPEQWKTAERYECGYMTYDFIRNRYEQRPGIHYDRCNASKHYFCRFSLYLQTSNWDLASSECKSHLWHGSSFSFLRKEWNEIELWIQRVRRFQQGIVSRTINIDTKRITRCGTNSQEVKRNTRNNCEEHWELICAFNETVTDTDTFTRTCFEEQTTVVPVNVTRMLFGSSTIVVSAVNRTTNEHKGPAADSIAIIVATIIAVCCISIGIVLICYLKQRRIKKDKDKTTVRYANENLSSTTANKNPPDDCGSSSDLTNTLDMADELYEACDAQHSGMSIVQDMYTTTEQQSENENVYSACRKETTSQSTRNVAAIQIEESEYDSTRNIKQYEKSSNIYNTLGFEDAESVYDSGQYKKDKDKHVDSRTYSSFSVQDTTYNTTAGLNDSRQNHGLSPLGNNVYSISYNDGIHDDNTYENVFEVKQTANGGSVYDAAYHYGTKQ